LKKKKNSPPLFLAKHFPPSPRPKEIFRETKASQAVSFSQKDILLGISKHLKNQIDMKNVFIISGPSGAGEDSIIDGISKLFPIERAITTTTRTMRPGESDGSPYYFISEEEFRKRLDRGEFIEHAEQYNGNLYGVTAQELDRLGRSGKVGIWKIEYKGVESAKRLFPEVKAILISAPIDILEERIRRRDNPSEEFIRERMAYTKEWLKHTDIYDYVVENEQGKLDEAVEKVADIIRQHADF
jgi:guanylate kinase